MAKRIVQGALRLSSIHNAVSLAGLSHLYRDILPLTQEPHRSLAVGSLSHPPQPLQCPECKTELGAANELYSHFAVCDHCGYHFVWSASQRIAHLADAESFKAIGQDIQPMDFLHFTDEQPYATKLLANQAKTGLRDAVLIGRCRIGSTETVLVVLDFHFMGGSMGSVVGEQVTVAFEYARKHRLPIVTVVNSGGARMQEGIISLMQMPKTAAAVEQFHHSGLLYLSILTSPTTGGVFASFASLGDVILAEPGAIIGFAGPRVAEQVTGQKLPAGSHRAETLLAAGQLDAIVARRDLPHTVATLLKATITYAKQSHSASTHTKEPLPTSAQISGNTAWEIVNLVRRPDRLTAQDYISYLSPQFLELHGDRCYGDDPRVVAGLGELDGQNVLFVGQERLRNTGENQEAEPHGQQVRPQPEGYRKAIRVMELATRFHCPLVTFVDTTGADPGDESERHGIAWSIAHSLSTMSSLPVPVVTVIIGEGASGGAVAFAVADYILMLENAIYEVIGPEGAATILYRDAGKASQVTEQLKLTAYDCLQLGVIDAIVPETQADGHIDSLMVMQALQKHLLLILTELKYVPTKQLLTRRYHKFRRHGRFQHKPYLLTRASVTAVEQGQNIVHHLKNRFPVAIIARLSAHLPHRGGHENGLAS